MNFPQAKQISDKGNFLLIILLIYEEDLMELEYYHFATPNELMNRGNYHQRLRTRVTRHKPHDKRTQSHHLKKSNLNLINSLALVANLQVIQGTEKHINETTGMQSTKFRW